MNKQLLIVLLAVCLVSTHAFVKREATIPTGEDLNAQLAIAQAKLQEIMSKLSQETSKSLDPDTIKKNFNDLVDAAGKAIQALTPTTEAPKPAA